MHEENSLTDFKRNKAYLYQILGTDTRHEKESKMNDLTNKFQEHEER